MSAHRGEACWDGLAGGISFSAPLVPRVYDGTKTKTRRMVTAPKRWGLV